VVGFKRPAEFFESGFPDWGSGDEVEIVGGVGLSDEDFAFFAGEFC